MGLISNIRELLDRRRILKDFNAYRPVAEEQKYWDFRNAMKEALELVERDHMARASTIWRTASAQYPKEAMYSELTPKLLLKLQLYKELDELMARAAASKPNDPTYHEALANSAVEQRQYDRALNCSRLLMRRYPDRPAGYLAASTALSNQGMHKEAEQLIASSFCHIDNGIAVYIEYARLADRKDDWTASLTRWKEVYDRFKHPTGIAGSICALGRLGRFDEADQLFEEFKYTYGNEISVWMHYVNTGQLRGDQEETLARWSQFRTRFPKSWLGYIGPSEILSKLGRHNEAEELLGLGIRQVDPEPRIMIGYALAAQRRSDWITACTRWAEFRSKFPGRDDGIADEAVARERARAQQ